MTSLPVEKSLRAELDIGSHFQYIASDNERAACRFLDEVEDALKLIGRVPGIGTAWRSNQTELRGLRYVGVSHRFRNYLIFFRLLNDRVQIVRVLHGMRDLPRTLSEN
jgi:toxin ParE1/3/4